MSRALSAVRATMPRGLPSSQSISRPTARQLAALGAVLCLYRADRNAPLQSVTARAVIGADGARSQVAQQAVPGADKGRFVFAYHEIIKTPATLPAGYEASRCDVFYQGHLSPDFYAWVFPHGDTASIGLGSANKGFPLRETTALMREQRAIGATNALADRHEQPQRPRPDEPAQNGHDGAGCFRADELAE